jgi:hypothetical protein
VRKSAFSFFLRVHLQHDSHVALPGSDLTGIDVEKGPDHCRKGLLYFFDLYSLTRPGGKRSILNEPDVAGGEVVVEPLVNAQYAVMGGAST